MQSLTHENLQKALIDLQKKNWESAAENLNKLLEDAHQKKNLLLQTTAYSCLGLLAQLKKEWKESWRYYEKAERLDPQNGYYKLLVARLLLRLFGQNDTAIKKCEKIIMQEDITPALRHQAFITIGSAYLKKSDRKRAAKSLLQSIGEHFSGIQKLSDLDMTLLEGLIRRNTGTEECKYFLEEAKMLALSLKDLTAADQLTKLLISFPN
ncbi:MAG: hypothetical protein HQM15_00560 [Deltaproteobacteria bacterium]|nr:hypothetical protein [Deltaproteobacteria bacterium]